MAKKLAIVTCKFCKKQFDRERLPFVQIPTGKVMRYAHPDCYKQAKDNKLIDGDYVVTDPTDSVMCAFCNKPMKRSSVDCKEVSAGRYMHLACFAQDQAKEKSPEEKLMDFLMAQCRYEFVPPSVQKQIKKMIDQSGFTYSGIHGTLKYWWIIKGKNIDKDNPVGIVPYIYEQAKNFYKQKALVAQTNSQNIKQQTTKVNYITIRKPILEKRKDNNFAFLDEEENNE